MELRKAHCSSFKTVVVVAQFKIRKKALVTDHFTAVSDPMISDHRSVR